MNSVRARMLADQALRPCHHTPGEPLQFKRNHTSLHYCVVLSLENLRESPNKAETTSSSLTVYSAICNFKSSIVFFFLNQEKHGCFIYINYIVVLFCNQI